MEEFIYVLLENLGDKAFPLINANPEYYNIVRQLERPVLTDEQLAVFVLRYPYMYKLVKEDPNWDENVFYSEMLLGPKENAKRLHQFKFSKKEISNLMLWLIYLTYKNKIILPEIVRGIVNAYPDLIEEGLFNDLTNEEVYEVINFLTLEEPVRGNDDTDIFIDIPIIDINGYEDEEGNLNIDDIKNDLQELTINTIEKYI